MYLSEQAERDMILDVPTEDELPRHHHHQQPPPPPPPQLIFLDNNNNSGDDNNNNNDINKAPKKRAETWVHEETRTLIGFRKEMDKLFNTSKSNKHLWEQISLKMRDKGFDRAPSMCTEKWRNLLKDFKKAKQRVKDKHIININNNNSSPSDGGGGGGGFDDADISFGPVEGSNRQTLNLERRLDHDDLHIPISPDAVAASPPWTWRDSPATGGEGQPYSGKVINVKCGDYARRIGIDGSADGIKDAIRSAFSIRTKRGFWLEDEDQVIRCIDRDMPLGNYNLHVDAGMTIKVCLYNESDLPVHTEEKVFYTEDDYRGFLALNGWTCLKEISGFRYIDNMDDFRPGGKISEEKSGKTKVEPSEVVTTNKTTEGSEWFQKLSWTQMVSESNSSFNITQILPSVTYEKQSAEEPAAVAIPSENNGSNLDMNKKDPVNNVLTTTEHEREDNVKNVAVEKQEIIASMWRLLIPQVSWENIMSAKIKHLLVISASGRHALL
ncbi:hypothetical protein ACFE04_025187 [Oxalis oulophora]